MITEQSNDSKCEYGMGVFPLVALTSEMSRMEEDPAPQYHCIEAEGRDPV